MTGSFQELTLREIIELGRERRLHPKVADFFGFEYDAPIEDFGSVGAAFGLIPAEQVKAYDEESRKKSNEFYSRLIDLQGSFHSFLHKGELKLEDTRGHEFVLGVYTPRITPGSGGRIWGVVAASSNGTGCAYVNEQQAQILLEDKYHSRAGPPIFVDPHAPLMGSKSYESMVRRCCGYRGI